MKNKETRGSGIYSIATRILGDEIVPAWISPEASGRLTFYVKGLLTLQSKAEDALTQHPASLQPYKILIRGQMVSMS